LRKLPSGWGQTPDPVVAVVVVVGAAVVVAASVVGATVAGSVVVVAASVVGAAVVEGAAVDRQEARLGDVQTNVSGSKMEVPGQLPM